MWTEGAVNPNDEHVVISYGELGGTWTPIARLAAGPGRGYTVQFVFEPGHEDQRARDMLQEVLWDLDFHLVELDEPDPWAYPRYHGETTWNVCGSVHWSLHRRDKRRQPVPAREAVHVHSATHDSACSG